MHHDACYSNMQVTCMLCAIAVGYVTIATGMGIRMLDCAVCSLGIVHTYNMQVYLVKNSYICTYIKLKHLITHSIIIWI